MGLPSPVPPSPGTLYLGHVPPLRAARRLRPTEETSMGRGRNLS
jgi:hypothetical protein